MPHLFGTFSCGSDNRNMGLYRNVSRGTPGCLGQSSRKDQNLGNQCLYWGGDKNCCEQYWFEGGISIQPHRFDSFIGILP